MLIPLLLTVMATVLLSNCSVKIQDMEVCSPIPDTNGAVCDYFLHSEQEILDETQWIDKQASWGSSECMSTQSFANIKIELEQLCSKTKCSDQTKKAIKGITRLINANGVNFFPEDYDVASQSGK